VAVLEKNEVTVSNELRIVLLMCLAEVLSMTGFAAYPAFLATLRDIWALSNSEAGFISGAFFAGYMAAVPVLSSLTDRLDARRIHLGSCLLAGAGTLLFALLAGGVVTAALFQALIGAGLGGTYMPGLKALTDRVGGARQGRYIAFYTATFGIGTSLSLLLAGWLGNVFTWRWTFALLASGPTTAAFLIFRGLRPQNPAGLGQPQALRRMGEVLRDHSVRGYILGYFAHCWELFGLRSWMVAFLVFSYGLAGTSRPLLSPTEASAAINLLGLPASILGNEAAGRLGRARYVSLVMMVSGSLAWLAGFSSGWPWWGTILILAIYNVSVMADSAALTAGLVAATPAANRGSAMAVYSFLGFGGGFVAPLVFGTVLDVVGGKANPQAWGFAFASLGAGCLILSLLARFKNPNT
jgi:MFS family permease